MSDNNRYTVEQQRELGYLPQRRQTWTPAHDPGERNLSDADRGVLTGALNAGAAMMTHRQQTHHAHSDDSAVGMAVASLIYSGAYALALAFITAGLLLIGWMFLGGSGGRWLVAWLVVWGLACLGALIVNRWQGLYFSPAGIAHHEIDSRERVAMHAIDAHASIIERRLGLAEPDHQTIDVGRRLQ